MGTGVTHRDLAAWREAMNLVEAVYRDSESFPPRETFGLTGQIRRAAISIPSNIAEGAGRNSPKEFLHYVGISCGSVAELDTQLELAVRLGYIKPNSPSMIQTDYVGRLIRALRKSLRQPITGSPR
jgi:four helix bundle protein